MDALMAALVVALLAQIGDRPALLAAILADRYRRPGLVIAAGVVAVATASAIAATGGALIGPTLTPRAQALLLALALALQGGGALFPAKPPERLAGWRVGVAATSFLGLFILLFGDGVQFVVAGLAAASTEPAIAAGAATAGATLGTIAVIAPAALLGEAAWAGAPLTVARRVIGVLFLLAAGVLALRAWDLV